jgi:hypothetical protein
MAENEDLIIVPSCSDPVMLDNLRRAQARIGDLFRQSQFDFEYLRDEPWKLILVDEFRVTLMGQESGRLVSRWIGDWRISFDDYHDESRRAPARDRSAIDEDL